MREARVGARRFHVDVMDGVFLPSVSFGASVVEAGYATLNGLMRWASVLMA